MHFRVFLSLLLCFYATLTIAETKVYHWVDAKGKSHFSDTAPANTSEVIIETQNLVSTPAPEVINQISESNMTGKNQSKIEPIKVIQYQADIVYPKDDTAIRSNEGSLEIYVETVPAKSGTQQLQLYLDGQPLGSPQISPTIRALNVDRGTHQLQVHLLDESGKTLAKTQIVTIHLKRFSVK